MASVMAASPAAHFRSPLRSFRAEACDRVATAEVYADAQARLAQWRKDTLSAASFDAQQALRDLSHERQHLKDLAADLASVKSLVQVASQLQVGGERLSEALRSASEAGANRAQVIARINDDLLETCERRTQELQQEERSIEQQRTVANAQHAEAFKLLTVYKGRLGFEITREAPQTVRMAFTFVDEANADRECYFVLGLSFSDQEDTDSYCVKECVPPVPQLTKLLAELNINCRTSAALPRFVCQMRRAFIESAKHTQ